MLLLLTTIAVSCTCWKTGLNFIRLGRYKKISSVGGDKMLSMVDYTERDHPPDLRLTEWPGNAYHELRLGVLWTLF